MRTYDDAYAAAVDEPAFSNSDEGIAWMDRWCARCFHDREQQTTGDGPGCPLVMVSLMGRRPSEWLDGPRDEHGRYSMSDQYHCVEFRADDDPDDREPAPSPEPPDMDGLFERPEATVRMFKGVVERADVPS